MDNRLKFINAIKNRILALKEMINGYDIEINEKHIHPLFKEKIEIIEEELSKITTATRNDYMNIDRLLKIKYCFICDKQDIEVRNLIAIKKKGVHERCPKYDMLGDCTFRDCLICPNCDFKIITHEGEIIQDFIYPENENMEVEIYTIELNNKVSGNLNEFFLNNTNEYNIVKSDKTIKQLIKNKKTCKKES